MLFRPVADSTSKLLSSNISNAAHLVVSVYVYRGQVRDATFSLQPDARMGIQSTLAANAVRFASIVYES